MKKVVLFIATLIVMGVPMVAQDTVIAMQGDRYLWPSLEDDGYPHCFVAYEGNVHFIGAHVQPIIKLEAPKPGAENVYGIAICESDYQGNVTDHPRLRGVLYKKRIGGTEMERIGAVEYSDTVQWRRKWLGIGIRAYDEATMGPLQLDQSAGHYPWGIDSTVCVKMYELYFDEPYVMEEGTDLYVAYELDEGDPTWWSAPMGMLNRNVVEYVSGWFENQRYIWLPIVAIVGTPINDDPGEGGDTTVVGDDTTGVGIARVERVEVEVYPNPAQEKINIRSAGKIEEVMMYSIDGRKIKEEKTGEEIEVRDIPDGIYTLRVVTDRGVAVRKVIVRKR